ncbi:MAG: endopeptidase La [Planctomycetia bacterium]|nr:endopeptidase La [Planctomycetia bacterium]
MPVAIEAGPADTGGRAGTDDHTQRVLPVLPLNDVVLFPSMVAPLVVNTQRSMKLAEDIAAGDRLFIAVLQREGDVPDDKVEPSQLHTIGCIARMIRMLRFPDESLRILVQGQHRCRLTGFEKGKAPYLRAGFTTLKDDTGNGIEMEALARNASQRFQEVITLSPSLPEELKVALFNIDDPAKLSDLIAANLPMPMGDRQGLLDLTSVRARLERITVLLNREREVLRLGNEIQSKVSETFSKSQREYFLREQLKQIRTELGESDQQSGDQQALRKRIDEAKLPKEARTVADKELGRLTTISPMSPEYGVIRTYLDWMVDMPWDRRTEDRIDLAAARRVLDRDHYGLAKIKERIVEFLAVLKLRRDLKGPIICFVGPPGVGKTSLGQSVAHALGRTFVRMSLGGVHDEAEIRGHRRTYIGAMPGRILQGLRRAGTRNPVFMLDEIDKVGQDFRGDPSSALLEVLDPEQNHAFQDHYLDVAFDLSQVLFITTANMLDTIPPPLRDRMEVLEIAGYTLREKLHIARRHLVPKQLAAHGLTPARLRFPDAALETIIAGYTREAGVRNLEREIAGLCRKAARNVAGGRKRRLPLDAARLRAWLGPKKFDAESVERNNPPGVSTGLAWTPTGGDILFVEATSMPGKGRLVLTGLLGDVMKESAQAAVSFVRSRAESLGLPPDFTEKNDLHIHVPAGAIPKDGPSAGLAIVTALVSLLTQRAVPPDLAMTGEITLRGRVMPVGGIKEKVLAAARAGIRHLVLPTRNADDLREIPADIRRSLSVKRVRDIDTALDWIFRDVKPAGRGDG